MFCEKSELFAIVEHVDSIAFRQLESHSYARVTATDDIPIIHSSVIDCQRFISRANDVAQFCYRLNIFSITYAAVLQLLFFRLVHSGFQNAATDTI